MKEGRGELLEAELTQLRGVKGRIKGAHTGWVHGLRGGKKVTR